MECNLKPFEATQRVRHPPGRGAARQPITQAVEITEEDQPGRRVGVGEAGQEEPAEQAGEHLHRQQEAGSAAYPTGPVQ